MNNAQNSVTAAYAVILGVALVADNWFDSAKNLVTKFMPSNSPAPANSTTGINRFEAFVASYVIFMLAAESETIAPVSGALAWAFAGVIVLSQFGAIEQKFPELFSKSKTNVPVVSSQFTPTAGVSQNGQGPI